LVPDFLSGGNCRNYGEGIRIYHWIEFLTAKYAKYANKKKIFLILFLFLFLSAFDAKGVIHTSPVQSTG